MNRIGLIVASALLVLMLTSLDAVHRRPAPVRRRLRARRDQGSDHRAGAEAQAAAAVPERRVPRPPHPDARQPRDAPDLHRREEEPGDRLARQVAHRRAAPVHPQQRRRHAQRREPAEPDRAGGVQRRGDQAHGAGDARHRARARSCRTCASGSPTKPSRSASRSSTCASSASTSSANITDSVYRRMESERKQVANELRSHRRRRGREDPRRRRPPARGHRRRGLSRRAEDQGRGRCEGDRRCSPMRSAAIRSSRSSIAASRPTARASAASPT